jgi:hypothetical protein
MPNRKFPDKKSPSPRNKGEEGQKSTWKGLEQQMASTNKQPTDLPLGVLKNSRRFLSPIKVFRNCETKSGQMF